MTDRLQMPIGPQPVQPGSPTRPKSQPKSAGPSFDQVFQEAVKGVKFSAHAEKRLQDRGIKLDAHKLEELAVAIDKVESKGGKESLILMDEMALIVSVKNRTVITAMDSEALKSNVFTNIDSAIIT